MKPAFDQLKNCEELGRRAHGTTIERICIY